MVLISILCLAVSSPSNDVDKGVSLYEKLHFTEAIPHLEQALADVTLPQNERIRALAYLGRAHAILGHPLSAEQVFIKLLELEPKYRIDGSMSPRIRRPFDKALAAQAQTQKAHGAKAQPLPALDLPPKYEPPPRLYQRPLFWVAASAVVVGIGTSLFLLFRPSESGRGIYVEKHL